MSLLSSTVGPAAGRAAARNSTASWVRSTKASSSDVCSVVSSARALLGPSHSEELTQRLEALARSRADLVAAVDGTLTIDSPPGGPTIIAAELPCES
jgi:hypothetical protein